MWIVRAQLHACHSCVLHFECFVIFYLFKWRSRITKKVFRVLWVQILPHSNTLALLFILLDGPISLCNTKAKPPIIHPIFICLCNGHSLSRSLSLSFFQAFSLPWFLPTVQGSIFINLCPATALYVTSLLSYPDPHPLYVTSRSQAAKPHTLRAETEWSKKRKR